LDSVFAYYTETINLKSETFMLSYGKILQMIICCKEITMKIVSIDDNENNLILIEALCLDAGLEVKSFFRPT